MSSNFKAYPYPIHSMTLNKIDEPTIKISFEFIKEFGKDKIYNNIFGHCVFCQNQSPISNSMLEYLDKEYYSHVCCVCYDCVNKYDENNK